MDTELRFDCIWIPSRTQDVSQTENCQLGPIASCDSRRASHQMLSACIDWQSSTRLCRWRLADIRCGTDMERSVGKFALSKAIVSLICRLATYTQQKPVVISADQWQAPAAKVSSGTRRESACGLLQILQSGSETRLTKATLETLSHLPPDVWRARLLPQLAFWLLEGLEVADSDLFRDSKL